MLIYTDDKSQSLHVFIVVHVIIHLIYADVSLTIVISENIRSFQLIDDIFWFWTLL